MREKEDVREELRTAITQYSNHKFRNYRDLQRFIQAKFPAWTVSEVADGVTFAYNLMYADIRVAFYDEPNPQVWAGAVNKTDSIAPSLADPSATPTSSPPSDTPHADASAPTSVSVTLSAVDVRIHALNLAVAQRREPPITFRVSRDVENSEDDDSDRETSRRLTEATLEAARAYRDWLQNGDTNGDSAVPVETASASNDDSSDPKYRLEVTT